MEGYERSPRDAVHAFVSNSLLASDGDVWPWLRSPVTGSSSAPEDQAFQLLAVHLALQTMLEVKKYLTLQPHFLTNMARFFLTI